MSRDGAVMKTLAAMKLCALSAIVGGAVALMIAGCEATGQPDASSGAASAPTTRPALVLGLFPPPPERSGEQLWADNCTRCHYTRPPNQYTDAQWEVIGHHMRLRADLTGEEQRKIVEFLKSAR